MICTYCHGSLRYWTRKDGWKQCPYCEDHIVRTVPFNVKGFGQFRCFTTSFKTVMRMRT